jgi:hypothetical protein
MAKSSRHEDLQLLLYPLDLRLLHLSDLQLSMVDDFDLYQSP